MEICWEKLKLRLLKLSLRITRKFWPHLYDQYNYCWERLPFKTLKRLGELDLKYCGDIDDWNIRPIDI